MHIVKKVKDSKPQDITCGIMRILTSSKDSEAVDVAHVTIVNSTKTHYHEKLTEIFP